MSLLTDLFDACKIGDAKTIFAILEASKILMWPGAKVSPENYANINQAIDYDGAKGVTIIHLLAKYGHDEILKTLLIHPMVIDSLKNQNVLLDASYSDNDFNELQQATPLHLAAAAGHSSCSTASS